MANFFSNLIFNATDFNKKKKDKDQKSLIQKASDFFRPKTGTLATKGRELLNRPTDFGRSSVQNFLNRPLNDVMAGIGNTANRASSLIRSTPVLGTGANIIDKTARNVGQNSVESIRTGYDQFYNQKDPVVIPYANVKVNPKIAGVANTAMGIAGIVPALQTARNAATAAGFAKTALPLVPDLASEATYQTAKAMPYVKNTMAPEALSMIAGMMAPGSVDDLAKFRNLKGANAKGFQVPKEGGVEFARQNRRFLNDVYERWNNTLGTGKFDIDIMDDIKKSYEGIYGKQPDWYKKNYDVDQFSKRVDEIMDAVMGAQEEDLMRKQGYKIGLVDDATGKAASKADDPLSVLPEKNPEVDRTKLSGRQMNMSNAEVEDYQNRSEMNIANRLQQDLEAKQKAQGTTPPRKELPYVQNNAPGASVTDNGIIPTSDLPPEAIEQAARQPKNMPPEGMKERKFIDTVRQSERTAPEVADKVESFYRPLANDKTLKAAQQYVDMTGIEESVERVRNAEVSAEKTAVGLELMRRFQNDGEFSRAIDLAEELAEQATTQGQAIQALSMWSRLTPEGALAYAGRLIKKANKDRPSGKQLELGEELAKEITDVANDLQKMPDGEEKIRKAAVLMDKVGEAVPPSLGEKIAGLQTMAQLLNPKTAIRNLVGNLGFQAIENAKDTFLAAPLDAAVSLFTGKRTKALPSISTQVKGAKEGFMSGLKDALAGVDTSGAQTKFDIPDKKVFRNRVGKFFQTALDIELRATDRAFYESAFRDSIQQQTKLAKVSKPTEEMIKIATYDAMYRTFQDDSISAKLFTRLKRGFNTIGIDGGKFGLGDLVLKYPKTPGNILNRAIEYSPAGFIQSVIELGRPIVGGDFNQRQFVESTSRATAGSAGLMAAGAYLHDMGIITGEPTDDYDINAVQRERGLGDYRVNTSALMRLIFSGFDVEKAKPQPGDEVITYDWFQPQAISFAIGADIDANKATAQGIVGKVIQGFSSSANTLVEQPLLTGLNTLFGYNDPVQGARKALESMPASFIPTFLNQIRQLTDNASRDPYDPDSMQYIKNTVKNKLPYASKSLPQRVDTRGREIDYNERKNPMARIFDTFVNPSFVSKLKDDPVGDEVIRMYESSGLTQQAPRKVSRKITVNGEQMTLNGKQVAEMQKYVGTYTDRIFTKLVENPEFMQLPDEEKAKYMSDFMTDIHTAAKIVLFEHRPERVSNGTLGLAKRMKDEFQSQGNISQQMPYVTQ